MRADDLLAPDKNKSYSAFENIVNKFALNLRHPYWDYSVGVAIVTTANICNWKSIVSSFPNNLIRFWMP